MANNVQRVEDGQQALHFIFATGPYSDGNIKNSPRVVLLDLNLPKVDGLEVLRRVNADERTKMIPVVRPVLRFQSSSWSLQDMFHCQNAPALQWLGC